MLGSNACVRVATGVSCALFSLMVTKVQAAAQELTLWRGEKTTALLQDNVELGLAPAGFEIKVGTAEAVRYRVTPDDTHYASVADRVVWGVSDAGVRVVSIAAKPDVAAGTYACGNLAIKVVDRVLPPPAQWRYYLDLWQHPWAVARYFGVKPFTPQHYRVMAPVLRTLAEAGQKALTITLLDQPWNHQCCDAYGSMVRHIKCADGSWRFDYRDFDSYVAFGRSCGIGPHIACYTMCPWGYRVNWEDERGNAASCEARPGTPAFDDYWGPFLKDFAAHLKAKGWFADTFIAMDERSPEDVMNIGKLVQAKAPGLKISLAGNRPPSDFKGIELDNCCFILSHLSDKLLAEAASRRADGKITTFYVCCGPVYPNTFCTSQLAESFWLGAYPSVCGLDGFLRWAWNSWPRDPMQDASFGFWRAGDTFLVYPDGSPSLRFLELRNGIIAAEKMRILQAEGKLTPADIQAKLGKLFDRAQAMKNQTDFKSVRAATQRLVNAQ